MDTLQTENLFLPSEHLLYLHGILLLQDDERTRANGYAHLTFDAELSSVKG